MIVKTYCEVEVLADENDLEKINTVYCLTFPNGKKYIGLTSLILRERISAHCSNSFNRSLTRYKTKVYGAIRKYMTFSVSVLYQGEELEENEIKYITEYNTFHNGYNLTSGGEHNKEVSELTRLKISKSNKGRSVVNKGIPMSEELRLLVSKRCKEAYLNGRINPQRKQYISLTLTII